MKNRTHISQRQYTVRGAILAILALGAFVTPSSSHAQLIAYDGFDYTSGANLNGQSGGTGWTGNWAASYGNVDQISTGGLSYTDGLGNVLTTSGNAVSLSGTVDTGFTRGVTFGGVDGTTQWMSFLIMNVDTSTYAGINFPAFGAPYIGDQGSSTWGLGTFGGGTQTNAGAVVVGQSTLLLTKIEFGATDTLTLYLNPTLGTTPTGGVSQTYSITNSITDILLAHGGSNYTLDEIRIGDTFADVTPFTPVPEPGTSVLLGVAMMATLFFRKRGARRA